MSTETTRGETKFESYPEKVKPEEQNKEGGPGIEKEMRFKPIWDLSEWVPSEKLKNKVALITGGDSGIGRAVSVLFAKEGCDVAIVYLPDEQEDADVTRKAVEQEKRKCLLLPGDIMNKDFCFKCVKDTVDFFGKLDILVNHAGMQEVNSHFEEVSQQTIENTFKVNVFSYLYFTQAAIPYLKEGSSIINTTSVNAYIGNDSLVEYTTTKGANRAFTYSMAKQLAQKGIRVNGVAPGPIWTPLIVSTFPKDQQKDFGSETVLGRPGQPEEIAPAYLFLACNQMSSFITGSILHPNGGMSTDS